MRSPTLHFSILLATLAGCGANAGSNDEASTGGSATSKGGADGASGSSTGGSSSVGGAAQGGTSTATGGVSATGGSGGNVGSVGGTVGTGGSAGSGGSGGTAPHVIGKCDGLGDAGTWENISPPAWASDPKNEALAVATDPGNAGTLYAAAGSKTNGGNGGTGIHKSTDCGATWVKISTGSHGTDLENGDTWQLRVDPMNAQVLYATNGYGSPASLFKSTNAGVDWIVTVPDGGTLATAVGGAFVQGFSLDPTNSEHIVITFHFNCGGDYAPMCMAETTNGGTDWRPFKGPTDGWGEGAGPIVLGANSWLYVTGSDIYLTTDSGATWDHVGTNGGGFPFRAPDGTLYLGGNYGMVKSTDGVTWTAVPNSPKANGVIGDGTTMFAVYQNDTSGHPVYSAPQSDPTTWTNVPSPTIKQGGGNLAVDPDHHLFYGAFWSAGLWRYVKE